MIPRFRKGRHPATRQHMLIGLVALVMVMLASLATTAHARCADVALVLAIDASGSIKANEFALQQQGYAQAFRSPRVQSALAAAGTVDIAVVLWGDTEMEPQMVPMTRLQSAGDAETLSYQVEALRRRVSGNTGIGRAVSTAIDMLVAPERCALRRLINLSGDGPETIGPRPKRHVPLAEARRRAEDLRITINALAIENDVADLGDWYRARLITGPGAFVMTVDGFESFSQAIEAKLEREIRPQALAFLTHGYPSAARRDQMVAPPENQD